MSNKTPELFIEINELNIIFVAGNYDDDLNFSILEKNISSAEDFFNNELINLSQAVKIVKENVEKIENKIDHVFKDVTVILDQFNCSSVNISGYKILNQSQILKENISYILNSLKLTISESEKDKSILHIFNSKSVLDGNVIENLPIGLFGNFYNHELTFFLIKKNDLKNIKQIFNKNGLNIKKIMNKTFIEGTQLIENNKDTETFYYIKIKKKSSSVSFFDNSAYKYFESFNFGTNILLQDISKVCSISYETIENILNNNIFKKENLEKDELVEKKFFNKENYRKIKKKLIKEIVKARIEEISNIILFNNTNTSSFKFDTGKIFVVFEDELFLNNFKDEFNYYFSKKFKYEATSLNDFEINSLFNKAAHLSVFGWRKEAIPRLETKNSLITRIFKSLFE